MKPNTIRRYFCQTSNTLPRYERLLLLLALFTFALFQYWHFVFRPGPLVDEVPYLNAIRALTQGHSPYVERYIYPPTLAQIGYLLSKFCEHHEQVFLCTIRILNILGICLAVSGCFTLFRTNRWARIVVPVLILGFWPPIVNGLTVGNISPAISGFAVTAMLLRGRMQLAAMILLGFSCALKPVTIPILLFLSLARNPGDSPKSGAIMAFGSFAICLITWSTNISSFWEFLQHANFHSNAIGNISILAFWAKLESPAYGITSIIAVLTAAVFVFRQTSLEQPEFISFACMFTVLLTPVLWTHSLILLIPLQIHSLHLAFQRYRDSERNRKQLVQLLLVMAGNTVIAGAETYNHLAVEYPSIYFILRAIPLVSIGGLGAYIYIFTTKKKPKNVVHNDVRSF